MVEHPAAYRWSSYRANGQGEQEGRMTVHREYLQLGSDAMTRQRGYRGLFCTHLESSLVSEIRQVTNGNYVLGNDRFKRVNGRLRRCWVGEQCRAGRGGL